MIVTGISVLESLNEEADVLEVIFDDNTTAYMFFKYADAMHYLNKDVIVSFRSDLYKGNIVTVVNTLTEAVTVHTVESEDNIKLFSEDIDNHSNVVFSDMQDGAFIMNAVMYCVDQTFESSSKAVWAELTVRDSRFKVRKLRLFEYDSHLSLRGKYIKCDVRKNKYGLTTSAIATDSEVPAETPDVAICRRYCSEYFSNREDVQELLNQTNFWNIASIHVDTVTGGALMCLAYELKLLSAYKDMLPGLMYEVLDVALLLTHMNALRDEDDVSPEMRAIITASNHRLDNRPSIFKIIDGYDNDVLTKEKEVFSTIRKSARELLRSRYD